MAIRSIAVHMAPTESGFDRLALAVALAETHDARLIGLGVADADELSAAATIRPVVMLEDHRRDVELSLETLGDHFLARTQDVRAIWRNGLGPTAAFCARESRAADLVVAGLQPEGEPIHGFRLDPADLVMQAGRPVLLAPPGVRSVSGKQVVLAWKPCREARLAAQLAMPFLVRADSVAVVGIGEEVEPAELADVCGWLRLHGVAAFPEHRQAKVADAAAALMGAADEVNADLIVSGAFRHGRLAEWALGGVTRGLLNQRSICCLMTH